ncbi:hypothetical protein [Limimaricola cinnabarinus]|uniref:hypothetical protein n=1 Tax=Limimaricola cinnabarinus TaxID=1125964 RepID=UPI0024902CB4|nr:hypothetical protein [Limimaricola cinnabarinus]
MTMTKISMLAIDLAKGSFQVCAVEAIGRLVARVRRIPRSAQSRKRKRKGRESPCLQRCRARPGIALWRIGRHRIGGAFLSDRPSKRPAWGSLPSTSMIENGRSNPQPSGKGRIITVFWRQTLRRKGRDAPAAEGAGERDPDQSREREARSCHAIRSNPLAMGEAGEMVVDDRPREIARLGGLDRDADDQFLIGR